MLGSEVEFVDSFCGDEFGTTGAFSELLMRFNYRLVAELLEDGELFCSLGVCDDVIANFDFFFVFFELIQNRKQFYGKFN